MKFLKTAAVVIGGLLPFMVAVAPANASSVTYDWTLTGPAASLGGIPFPASGTITATVSTHGGETVTGITGTIDGSTITGLAAGGDNLLFPSGTSPLDTSGIDFTTASGQTFNIFSFFAEGSPPSGNAYGELGGGAFGVGTFTLTPVAATPLPSTWGMMLLGLGVLGFMGYRRRGNKMTFAAV